MIAGFIILPEEVDPQNKMAHTQLGTADGNVTYI
jgi:hypothetical protein